MCAVVKADAYGLGARKICKTIGSVVDYFAVSSAKEFFDIKNLTNKPILILCPIYENITKLARFKCEFCVSNKEQFELFKTEAKRNKNIVYKIHLKINSGMNRFGMTSVHDIIDIVESCQKTQNIFICGIFSHFFDAKNEYFSQKQIKIVEDIKNEIEKRFKLPQLIFHISSTYGIDNNNSFDMVRVGMGLYSDEKFETIKLKSKVVELQNILPGETAGYSRCFVAKKETKVAVVSIGYADGILRQIAGRGYVLIRDEICKILAVCMDSIIVDVTSRNVKLYDDVILIGKDQQNQIFICDVATWCDTISYEIISRLSYRIKRRYKSGEICKLLRESIEQEN